MRRLWPIAVVVISLGFGGCPTSNPAEQIGCVNDADCPPFCECFFGSDGSGRVCELSGPDNDVIACAGTCALESGCPPGEECRTESNEGDNPQVFSCQAISGTGGSGGSGASGGSGGGGGTGGGTAGTGGTMRSCDAPLPEPSAGLFVDAYAVFDARTGSVDTRPGGISFATDETLFVGNVGGPDAQQQTVPVLQINPDADGIRTSLNDVRDPDVVIVDTAGSVATAAGNVYAGGENMQGIGQLTELAPDPFDIVDGEDILGSCIDNVTVMLFDQLGRLLVGNFDQSTVSAAVCAVQRNSSSEIEVVDLIEVLPGGSTEAIWGIVQEPDGDLFVSQVDSVHRFNSDGTIDTPDYTTGTALGYGPSGSAFDGLLILRGDVLFRRSNLADDQNDEELLTFTDATGTANYVAFRGADLYISQVEQKRILRVSTADLDPTELGCEN